MDKRTKRVIKQMCRKERESNIKENHETFKKRGLCLLKQDQQMDSQNNVHTRCGYVTQIFTKIFTCLFSIATE